MTEPPDLRESYDAIAPRANRFRQILVRETEQLLLERGIQLSVPVQHRTKSWSSVAEKLERKQVTISDIHELRDLVGLRLILQFRRDVEHVCELLGSHFVVLEREDVATRLRADQFGYASTHLLVRSPDAWMGVPTTAGFDDLVVEVQIRTAAQHIWASASHILQYKDEDSVPIQLRRSLYRVSALLETVDLEFERFLRERESYVLDASRGAVPDVTELNVELLRQMLTWSFPSANLRGNEDYADLLRELARFQVTTMGQLRALLAKRTGEVLERDQRMVHAVKEAWRKNPDSRGERSVRVDAEPGLAFLPEPLRVESGVFFSHAGLLRMVLAVEFPEEWATYALE
jgi:putative GTP pyrophosphokinase